MYIRYNNMHLNTCTCALSHGRLNITHDFGPHWRLPGTKIPYICIEAATVAWYMGIYLGVGAYPRHYSILITILI